MHANETQLLSDLNALLNHCFVQALLYRDFDLC
jgi:hypothetical protein